MTNLKDLLGETTMDNLEQITQGLKLLELIEKGIESAKPFHKHKSAHDLMICYECRRVKQLQKLLEESKK